ncbi:Uncharacterised protein [uncultured archaeon]|nr:Uncharacterised protein [uncultured archaeon]
MKLKAFLRLSIVDMFKTFLTTYPYSNGASLNSGNIQIHKQYNQNREINIPYYYI